MTKYTINVENASAADKQFFIFADKPQVSGGGGTVYQNVFLSDYIAAGSHSSFEFTRDIYAVTGKKKLQFGSTITQSTSKGPVTLGNPSVQGDTLRISVVNGAPRFVDNDPSNAPKGTFQIATGTDFNQGSDIFVGIGNKQEGSNVVTTASVQASPNATITIEPHIRYYVATGSYSAGTIIDVTTVGATKMIDFSGGSDQATAKYNPNGTWS